MQHLNKVLILFITTVLMGMSITNGQSHSNPDYLLVVSAEKPIVVDGVLDDTDWLKRYDHLIFGANSLPGDVTYTVTDSAYVKQAYEDTTTTFVKILHHGLDLYISLQSDDKYVGKFGTSWEGDGLFMKLKKANGVPVEYKLFWNKTGTDPEIGAEGEAGTFEGAAVKEEGTIVNDTSDVDAGYTAEMVIHLDQLGYTDPYAEVEVAISIFDPDMYVEDMDPYGEVGAYFKSWWGSEWGTEYKTLKLGDPLTKNAISVSSDITLDGELTESFWADAASVVVGKGSAQSTGGYYMQWTSETNTYDDQSMAEVKFVHNGTDLYIGVESDDKSVCKWAPGWEADGLFLWMTNKGDKAPATRMEIKNMFFDATEGAVAVFEVNDNVPTGGAEGASALKAGTVSHTETNGEDAGYTLEVVVHTDYFGYAAGDTVYLSVCIWDLDQASDDAWNEETSDYAPNWWGTQWADPTFEKYHMYRGVILSDATDIENVTGNELVTEYKLSQNYPNPFNPTTVINYSLPNTSEVSLKVYDILGNEIAVLVNNSQTAGSYNVSFDASNIPSGVYFYTLSTGSYTQTRKMLLIK